MFFGCQMPFKSDFVIVLVLHCHSQNLTLVVVCFTAKLKFTVIFLCSKETCVYPRDNFRTIIISWFS